ncbi:MAG: DUF58 domain-containing protein [Anaerolineales bacterium]|jgi:uncharacterized protein (DUF58 family)
MLLIIAALIGDDFIFTLIYLIAGAFFMSKLWLDTALRSVTCSRQFPRRVFLGERINVDMNIGNSSYIPIPWIRIHERLPVELKGPDSYQNVISLGPKATTRIQYGLNARKRGYYPIGPLFISSGDILGLSQDIQRQEEKPGYLTVYPKIIPLTKVDFPTRSPLGTLPGYQPIFEDPSRVFGKRNYVTGDSIRRVDWKSTAATGELLVKMFEPSITLETVIFLNLNRSDYHYRSHIDATELSIVIAASIANYIVGKKQSVGFSTNGEDPLADGYDPELIPPRKGSAHLMRILEKLARIRTVDNISIIDLLQQERVHLPWGTTLFLITGNADELVLDELFKARRSGQNACVVLSGPVSAKADTIHRATLYKIPILQIEREKDMIIWRR